MNDSIRHPRGELPAFAEQTLQASQLQGVSRHLLSCTECQAEVRQWRQLYQALATLPRPEVPAGLRDRIVFAVAREALVQRRRAWSLGHRAAQALTWAYGGGLAFAAALALGIILVPELREGAASAFTWTSAVGIQAGLLVVNGSSSFLAWTFETGGNIFERASWVETVARALTSASSVTELRIAFVVALLLTGVIAPLLILGGLPRRMRNRGVTNVHLFLS